MFVLGLTSKPGDLQSDLDQDGKWSQNVLTGVVERLLFPILTLVKGVELVRPLDPDLVLVGNVGLFVTGLILVPFCVVAPDILGAKLDAGLLGGWTDESDQSLDIDDSTKIRKTIFLQVSEVVFGS